MSEQAHPPSAQFSEHAHVKSMESYRQLYQQSINDPDNFWKQKAHEFLSFFVPYTHVRSGSLLEGNFAWFLNGKLNACYNAVDRHLASRKDQVAILWEGDEPGNVRKVTYGELFIEVCKWANMLKSFGVGKGDVVCIYLPMIPEAVFAMLACARIGAAHTVVFAGFSMDSLRDRIQDGNAKVVLTADEGIRAKKSIRLKDIVDAAVSECPSVTHVAVFKYTGGNITWHPNRDLWINDLLPNQRPYCPAELMDSEDILFLLYTSGSTGKPKGLAHTTAGYLLYAAFTQKYIFDYHDGDVFGCVADVGWITGHSYIVYGPLVNGATTFMFESTPLYPDAGRYWDMVQRHKINILYTAPTAIRALMKYGEEPVKKYDLSSLKVLGSVGEPINPEAWRWYNTVVGGNRCPIVDTYWQTETGGIVITPLPGATPTKPGSATFPFFGINPVLLDAQTGEVLKGDETSGVLAISQPWPGMARTVYGDHTRYQSVYLAPYKGYYFTGDGATRDKDGYYWITGRVDDVLNVSGHRLGSAEIESSLVANGKVAEAAVIGIPHDVKGTAVFAYVIVKNNVALDEEDLVTELKLQVRDHIGAFARPDHILITPALPKTRSGKIMRRLLRKIASQEFDSLGDITTLADTGVVEDLIERVKKLYKL